MERSVDWDHWSSIKVEKVIRLKYRGQLDRGQLDKGRLDIENTYLPLEKFSLR